MIPPLHGFRLLLVLLALGAAGAAVCGDAALAQQSQTPTELWEEYPLDPEGRTQQPGSGIQQGLGSRADPAQVGGDGGGAAPATDDGGFPLIPILVTMGILLFVLIPGVGVWALGGRAPEGLRDRIGAVRLPWLDRIGAVRLPSVDLQRPLQAVSRLRKGFLEHRPRRSWLPALWASRGQKATLGRRPVPGFRKPARAVDKPATPGKPKARAAAPKKKAAVHKAPVAKPQQAANPQPAAKPRQTAKSQEPRGAAKPPRAAKPQRAAKPHKPPRPAKQKRPADHRAPAAPVKPALTEALKPKPPGRKKTALVPAPVREERQPVATETLTERKLTCSIFGWRDGMLADFYALASGLRGHDWIVDRSPRFEWQVGDFPVEAYEAHAMLVDALIQAGWEPVKTEGVWYRQRFERPAEGLEGPEV